MYNDVVLDHFQNPRNVGEIENPSAYAKLASPSCGDLIEIFMNIDENEVITDVKFRTLGCAAAIASGSMATEMLKGKTVEEARRLTNQEVIENLGGLPAQKEHCSVLAEDVIEAALNAYEEKKKAK